MRLLTGTGLPKPSRLLAATVGLQWLVTMGVALGAASTDSIYGDPAAADEAVDAAISVTNGALPVAAGPLYSLLLAPLASLTTDVQTISSIVTTLTLVILAPLASYCLLELTQRIAGRIYAITAVLVWLLLPVAAIPFFSFQGESTYLDYVLPAMYGLTVHPAYLAMVLSLAAAMFALRATGGAPRAAFVAGLLGAAAVACLPVAFGVIAGVVVALAVAGRWRSVGEALAGALVGLVPTLIWRHQVLSQTITLGHPSWTGFQASMASLREFSFSNRLFQWLPIAGTIGVVRLSRPAGAMIAAWIAIAMVLGIATAPPFERGIILIELIPTWPAYTLAVAAIPALVPTLIRRLGSRTNADVRVGAPSRAAVWTLLALLVVLPAALVTMISR